MDEQNNKYKSLAKTLHKVEEAKRKLDYEVGTLISPDGRIIKKYIGGAHGINIPDKDQPLFGGNIFTHNHPGGRTFTVQDILKFIEDELYEVRVSTPQGMFFSLRESDWEINRSIGNVMKEEYIGDILKAVDIVSEGIIDGKYPDDIILRGKEYDFLVYDIMADEVDNWLIENAGEFGYIYEKGVL